MQETTGNPEKPNCRTCVHRLTIPGDTHSRCNAGLTASVVGHPAGVRNGWFKWPVNFDPTWLLACDSHSTNPADRKPRVEYSPLLELVGILK